MCAVAAAWFAWAPGVRTAPARGAVLTIHEGAASFPSNPIYDAAIRRKLLADIHGPIQYFTEYFDPDAATPVEDEAAFADYLRAKYAGHHIDVVITIADGATRFAVTHRDNLFPGAPIVFAGLYQPDEATRTAGGGLTGVRVGVAYARTLETALSIHPDTERVFVVANSPSAATAAMARTELSQISPRVSLTYLNSPTVAQLLDAVRAVPPRSLILYIWHPGT